MTKAVASVPIYYSASNIQVVDTYSEGVIIISKTILSLLSADNLYKYLYKLKVYMFLCGEVGPGSCDSDNPNLSGLAEFGSTY